MTFSYPPMAVFNERKRSLGDGEESKIFMQISVEMREYLHFFTPSSWMVFTFISLMTDADGWCYPNIETISQSTGLGKDTVSNAIKELEVMNINGSKVLLKINKKVVGGKFGNNRYLIFPSTNDIEIYGSETDKQILLPILNSETKTPKETVDTVVLPTPDKSEPLKKRYYNALKLYEESLSKKKKLVNQSGIRINNVSIISGLVMEVFGKQWKPEPARVAKLIKVAGNHWKVVDLIIESAGQVINGNPVSWLEAVLRSRAKNPPKEIISDTAKDSLVLAPGETLEERLEVLEALYETNNKLNLWKSLDEKHSTERTMVEISKKLKGD